MEWLIRSASEHDLKEILNLIRGLAAFEKAEDKVMLTEKQLLEDGFGVNPSYKAFVAEANGQILGFVLSFVRYSTWRGKILYIEDLYIKEEFRGMRIGSGLFRRQMDYARENQIQFLCFQVLDWNKKAIDFYKKFDVEYDAEWINGLITIPPTSVS